MSVHCLCDIDPRHTPSSLQLDDVVLPMLAGTVSPSDVAGLVADDAASMADAGILFPADSAGSQAARHLSLTVKVFFSLDFIYLVSLDRISGGYQEDILEQFEKSKMAAKMAAIVKKKLNHLILFIKSRAISLFPLNVIRGIHF